MNLENFLIISAILFSIGFYGALSKRNAITILMSIELMFNAVNLTAVAMSRYIMPAALDEPVYEAGQNLAHFLLTGHIFTVFIITVAAAEVALGLAIVICLYRTRGTVFVTGATRLRN